MLPKRNSGKTAITVALAFLVILRIWVGLNWLYKWPANSPAVRPVSVFFRVFRGLFSNFGIDVLISYSHTLLAKILDTIFESFLKNSGNQLIFYKKRRKIIQTKLVEKKLVSEISDDAGKSAIENTEGDVLASIIASTATYQALRNNFEVPDNELYRLEGYIYT